MRLIQGKTYNNNTHETEFNYNARKTKSNYNIQTRIHEFIKQ